MNKSEESIPNDATKGGGEDTMTGRNDTTSTISTSTKSSGAYIYDVVVVALLALGV